MDTSSPTNPTQPLEAANPSPLVARRRRSTRRDKHTSDRRDDISDYHEGSGSRIDDEQAGKRQSRSVSRNQTWVNPDIAMKNLTLGVSTPDISDDASKAKRSGDSVHTEESGTSINADTSPAVPEWEMSNLPGCSETDDDSISSSMIPPHMDCEVEISTTSLFVGDISQTVTADMIRQEFSKYGRVTSVEIKRDRNSGNSLGYCFVNFETPEDALRARTLGHRVKIGSRAVRIGLAQRNTSLYIPSLPPTTTSKDLSSFFSAFGELIEDDTYVVTHTYGFVRFKNRQDAESAKRQSKGAAIRGERFSLKWSEADLVRNSVRIQFNPADEKFLTRFSIFHTFHKYGRIVSIDSPANSASYSRGSAYVHYENSDAGYIAADNAIKKVKKVAGVQVWLHHAREFQPSTMYLQGGKGTVANEAQKVVMSGNASFSSSSQATSNKGETGNNPQTMLNAQNVYFAGYYAGLAASAAPYQFQPLLYDTSVIPPANIVEPMVYAYYPPPGIYRVPNPCSFYPVKEH